MICVDTTFLIHLWREKAHQQSAARDLLVAHPGELFTVPAHAAGEFLEGAATISPNRLAESLQFLRAFDVGAVTAETALRYARIVAELRSRQSLSGRSKPDLWIAAWAAEHGAPLATHNTAHFVGVPGLELIEY